MYEEKIERIFKIIFSYTQALWKVNAGKNILRWKKIAFNKMKIKHKTYMKKIREYHRNVGILSAEACNNFPEFTDCFF